MASDPTPPEFPQPPTPPPPENVPPAHYPPPPLRPIPSSQPGARPSPYHPNPDERSNGMLMHLLGLLTGFLGPLILWLVRKDSSPFLDHQGKEALNFQITILLVFIGFTIIGIGLAFLTLGLAALPMTGLFLVCLVLIMVWEITGCIRASRGEWYTYPVSIRIIR